MFDMKEIINKIESIRSDACGMVISRHKTHKFMESWFVRLNKKIFLSPWFDEFISSVTHESEKTAITIKYEHGLTNLIHNHNCSWNGVYEIRGRFTYNNPEILFRYGCPFVKRACFTRHYGDCGIQIKHVLKCADNDATQSVLKTANRIYTEKYMTKFLTSNPVKIWARKIRYAIYKMIKVMKHE